MEAVSVSSNLSAVKKLMLLCFNRQLKKEKHSYRQTKVRVEKVKISTTIKYHCSMYYRGVIATHTC